MAYPPSAASCSRLAASCSHFTSCNGIPYNESRRSAPSDAEREPITTGSGFGCITRRYTVSLEADLRVLDDFVEAQKPEVKARREAQRAADELTLIVARSAATRLYWEARGIGDYRPCEYCGSCPVPSACPLSVACPLCEAKPGEKCKHAPGYWGRMLVWHDAVGPAPCHDERFVMSVNRQRKLGIGRPASQSTPAGS